MSEPNPAVNSADLVSLGDEKRATEILAESILGLWEVVNNLTPGCGRRNARSSASPFSRR
jgi:hypothetical protein